MEYLFGVYCGILLASTAYFIIYSVAKCNQPVIYPKLILPGLISGILWGIAMRKQIIVHVSSLFYLLCSLLLQWGGSWPTSTSLLPSLSQ